MKSENEMELEKKKTSMEIELEFELSQEEERQWIGTQKDQEKKNAIPIKPGKPFNAL